SGGPPAEALEAPDQGHRSRGPPLELDGRRLALLLGDGRQAGRQGIPEAGAGGRPVSAPEVPTEPVRLILAVTRRRGRLEPPAISSDHAQCRHHSEDRARADWNPTSNRPHAGERRE